MATALLPHLGPQARTLLDQIVASGQRGVVRRHATEWVLARLLELGYVEEHPLDSSALVRTPAGLHRWQIEVLAEERRAAEKLRKQLIRQRVEARAAGSPLVPFQPARSPVLALARPVRPEIPALALAPVVVPAPLEPARAPSRRAHPSTVAASLGAATSLALLLLSSMGPSDPWHLFRQPGDGTVAPAQTTAARAGQRAQAAGAAPASPAMPNYAASPTATSSQGAAAHRPAGVVQRVVAASSTAPGKTAPVPVADAQMSAPGVAVPTDPAGSPEQKPVAQSATYAEAAPLVVRVPEKPTQAQQVTVTPVQPSRHNTELAGAPPTAGAAHPGTAAAAIEPARVTERAPVTKKEAAVPTGPQPRQVAAEPAPQQATGVGKISGRQGAAAPVAADRTVIGEVDQSGGASAGASARATTASADPAEIRAADLAKEHPAAELARSVSPPTTVTTSQHIAPNPGSKSEMREMADAAGDHLAAAAAVNAANPTQHERHDVGPTRETVAHLTASHLNRDGRSAVAGQAPHHGGGRVLSDHAQVELLNAESLAAARRGLLWRPSLPAKAAAPVRPAGAKSARHRS